MKRLDSLKLLYYTLFGLLLYFVLVPVISVILYGVFPVESFHSLRQSLQRSLPYLQNSLWVAGVVTVLSVLIGLIAAITINRFHFKGKRLLRYAVLLPLINPPFVGSIAFIMLFGKRGLVTHGLLGLSVSPYGWQGIVIMQTLSLSALAYLIISSAIVKIDPNLEEAARNLGASELQIFKGVTLKMMYPEISTAGVLVFLASMADFGTPLIIGGPFHTLASDLYVQITGVYNMKTAAISGILLLIPCILLFFLQRNVIGKNHYYSVSTANTNIIYPHFNRPLRYLFIIITILYALFVVIKYLFIIIGAVTKQWGYNYTFTLEHIKTIFAQDYSPFINSIQLAFVVAFVSSILGVLLSYMIKRKSYRHQHVVDLLATLPAAVPGILLGIGYLVTFKYPLFGVGRFWLHSFPSIILLGTGVIIYLISIFRYMNVGLRAGYALIQHLNPDIEDAARNLGQSENKIFTQIVLPLMYPAFWIAFLKNFSSTMTTLGAIIFLLLPSNKVAVQQIFQTITSSATGVAAAMALLLSLTTALILGVLKFINQRWMRFES
ncbi:ABC transporter permease [Rubeoparvulum massiliense]|uniref:ABC transporter permease n=1 Tax=Rubeoparvulum massiliense TaxID=1631346 RepID=UPI00065E4DE6|nr:iron ABC transporter permease [Rubeoparvulum massiliense]